MSIDTYVVGASGKAVILKDPNANLDYTFDWTAWLDLVSDTIASAQVLVPQGVTLEKTTIVGKKVIAQVSGGTIGATYAVTCRLTTTGTPDPRIEDRTIYLKIKDR